MDFKEAILSERWRHLAFYAAVKKWMDLLVPSWVGGKARTGLQYCTLNNQ